MSEEDRHPGAGLEAKLGERFSSDLKALVEPQTPVPAEVDRAVIDRVQQRFMRRRRALTLRWAGPVAAAAAVIVFALTINMPKRSVREPSTEQFNAVRSRAVFRPVLADIDASGRVDILDAFKLARHIESSVRPDKKWDINRDGRVNRADVDAVAFTAVRLDKGVM
jgi:hypothetical protein